MTLADRIAEVLVEQGPLPVCVIATTLRIRKAEVIATLNGDPRFVHNGLKARASRWDVAPPNSLNPVQLIPRRGSNSFDATTEANSFAQGELIPPGRKKSFDATDLLALHPHWSPQWAEEVIAWFVEVGFAESVSGNGTVHATREGELLSRDFGLWGEVTS